MTYNDSTIITANVIQTNSEAANTYSVQIQRASSQISSTIGTTVPTIFSSSQEVLL